jgi:hypothetical protein
VKVRSLLRKYNYLVRKQTPNAECRAQIKGGVPPPMGGLGDGTPKREAVPGQPFCSLLPRSLAHTYGKQTRGAT